MISVEKNYSAFRSLKCSGPIFPAGATAAWAGALNTRGRLRRAYQSAFCPDDKKQNFPAEI